MLKLARPCGVSKEEIETEVYQGDNPLLDRLAEKHLGEGEEAGKREGKGEKVEERGKERGADGVGGESESDWVYQSEVEIGAEDENDVTVES